MSPYDPTGEVSQNDATIGAGSADVGYIGAFGTSAGARLKLLVTCGDMSYNYDMPLDGTPIIAPVNMGNGAYSIRVMMNTHDSDYIEICYQDIEVNLENEFLPYLRPNMFCNYTPDSLSVIAARDLAQGAVNEADIMKAIFSWITTNVSYDTDKAQELSNATGYVPVPDVTFTELEGICFDYASLAASMFRSLGIPCKIVTGYVGEKQLYHSWNEIYINGGWVTASFEIDPSTWSLVDFTFSAQDPNYTPSGDDYTIRYTY